MAAESTARIIFYGGAKGGGKSFWLLLESAKWFDIPGRTATIFRRTYTELTGDGGLWNESFTIYPLLGGTPVESKHRWTFDAGGGVQMRHLQHTKDAKAYNGKNIGDVGFDELPFFEEEMFWTILSCQRSTAGGDPPKIRATMNPDPDSWVLQFVSWYLDESGFADESKSGVVRWFGRRSGILEWYDSEDAARAAGLESPMSFTFIAAKLWDNPALLKARPEYLANLRALPPIEQARYLGGNWKVRPTRGDYFQQQWFPCIPRSEIARVLAKLPKLTSVIRTWRAWDLAGTPVRGDQVVGAPQETHAEMRDDANWTRGWKFGLLPDGRVVLLDLASARDAPGAIEHLVRKTAEADGPACTVVVWQDPAQAGVHQVTTYKRLLRGFKYVTCLPLDPLIAAKLASEQAYQGRLLIPEGAHWLEEAFRELEGFPLAPHDDVVSALALGVAYWLEQPSPQHGKAHRPAEPEVEQEDEVQAPVRRGRNDVRATSRFKEHF